jgi:Spy/CpxP family protein refolding chaperone
MTKVKLFIIACFLFAFGAGSVVGVWASGRAGERSRHGPPRLTQELGLTPEQTKKMQEIWSGVMRSVGPGDTDQRRVLRDERDAAVLALLTPQQKAAYDKLMQDYSQKMGQLAQERRRAFEAAVERTKQMLNDEQRHKYEDLLKKREAEWRAGPASRGSRGGGWPTTRDARRLR